MPYRSAIRRACDAPGVPHQQAVGRLEGAGIELHRGVREAGHVVGERLELAVVGAREDRRPPVGHRGEDRLGERRALRRVGARADLVEENQSSVLKLSKGLRDIPDMPAEGGERLFKALFVADVGPDAGEGGEPNVEGGREEPALDHEDDQSDRLDRDRLAAGVGTGDEHRRAPAHLDVERHRDVRIEERVLAALDADERAARHRARQAAFHVVGHPGLREGEVELGGDFDAARRLGGDPPHGLGQEPEDARFLGPLLRLQFAERVAELEHVLGLDEEGLARRGGVVDDALDLAPVLRLQGHHVATVPHGVDRIAEQLPIPGGVGLDPLLEAEGGLLLPASDAREGGRCLVAHRPVPLEGVEQAVLDVAPLGKALGVGEEQREVVAPRDEERLRGAHGRERLSDLAELLPAQDAALLRPPERLTRVADASQRRHGVLSKGVVRLSGEVDEVPGVVRPEGRAQFGGGERRDGRLAGGGEPIADRLELEHAERVRVLGMHCLGILNQRMFYVRERPERALSARFVRNRPGASPARDRGDRSSRGGAVNSEDEPGDGTARAPLRGGGDPRDGGGAGRRVRARGGPRPRL